MVITIVALATGATFTVWAFVVCLKYDILFGHTTSGYTSWFYILGFVTIPLVSFAQPEYPEHPHGLGSTPTSYSDYCF